MTHCFCGRHRLADAAGRIASDSEDAPEASCRPSAGSVGGGLRAAQQLPTCVVFAFRAAPALALTKQFI
jgi:hypothetical protein